MVVSCHSCPLRRKSVFTQMTDSEVAFMQKFKTGELEVEAGSTLMMEGSKSPQLYTVLEGMGLRYKSMAAGDRQVINIVLPGDFVGLQAGIMDEMQHSVEATTAMTLCVFDRKNLWSLFRDQPERAYDLTWLAAVEEHLLGEALAMLGHMDGLQRIARAFVRIYIRGKALGLVQQGAMPLPYKQQDLADALGLSLVHTNKTLKKLREDGVAVWRNGVLDIKSYEKLCEIAQIETDGKAVARPLI
ncbi:Crp/Fnr family transcriptional regulator [uncultured Roseovarius sp.]|uniref:Crp/Fnr family transcriptional regulator n=1 Tax=uncultured Roseovarius sp. TaxID=293344 RepID=UPI0025E2C075|nr:Crp/Fnr family transcriptional regulator [uncultured Roseovarius sp.]